MCLVAGACVCIRWLRPAWPSGVLKQWLRNALRTKRVALRTLRLAWQYILDRDDFKPVASIYAGESAAISMLLLNAAPRLLAQLCDELQFDNIQLPRACKHADFASVHIPRVEEIAMISIECAGLDLALAAAWIHR